MHVLTGCKVERNQLPKATVIFHQHCLYCLFSAPVKLEKHLHSTRSEEGKLYYNGEWYGRGQTICIDRKDECPTRYDFLK